MSIADSFISVTSFQRLEDFPSYTSCIKSCGRSIIPPLLTEKQRNEIFVLKEAAIRKGNDVLQMKKEHLSISKKVRDVFYRVQDNLASAKGSEEFIPLSEMSALCLNIGDVQLSPSISSRSFASEMHVSMSKFPSSDICSTMHQGVIVCPNIINSRKKGKATELAVQMEPYGHFVNRDCHLCQAVGHQDFFLGPRGPYDNFSNEHFCSVSEQGSTAEETEFGSLDTVVCARKLNMHDIDNESNATFLTESTDIDKYMDCVYEFSSPDDVIIKANSHMSSQHTISSKSDDASSETLVNTESELTPCASAMAGFGSVSNGIQNETADSKYSACSVGTCVINQQDRAHSVDSYIEFLKLSDRKSKNLNMKKSQSEPSHSNATQPASCKDFLVLQNPEGIGRENMKSNKANEGNVSCQIKYQVLSPISDVEVAYSNNESDFNLKTEELGPNKKTHVRNNSYTLDEPSSVLIMAHANCNCKPGDVDSANPHSCSSENKSITPSKLAFKKEKVNIVLPTATSKLYPFLNPSTCNIVSTQTRSPKMKKVLNAPSENCSGTSGYVSDTNLSSAVDYSKEATDASEAVPNLEAAETPMENINSESIENSKGTSKTDCAESTGEALNSECHTNSVENLHLESVETPRENGNTVSLLNTCADVVAVNEQVTIESSMEESNMKSNDIQLVLNKIFQEVQESQQILMNQLIAQQRKQWDQLNAEFKEQEQLLCAKLNLIKTSCLNENSLQQLPSQPHSQPCGNDLVSNCKIEEIPCNPNIPRTVSTSSIGDVLTKESPSSPETVLNNYKSHTNLSEFSYESTSSQGFKPSEYFYDKSDGLISSANGDIKLHPSNILLNKSESVQSNIVIELTASIGSSDVLGSTDIPRNLPMSDSNTNDQLHARPNDVFRENSEDVQSNCSIKSAINIYDNSAVCVSNVSQDGASDVPSNISVQSQANVDYSLANEILDQLSSKKDIGTCNVLLQSLDIPSSLKYSLPVSDHSPGSSNSVKSYLSQYKEMYGEIHGNSHTHCANSKVFEDSASNIYSPVSYCFDFQTDISIDSPTFQTCPDCPYPAIYQRDNEKKSIPEKLNTEQNAVEHSVPQQAFFEKMNGYITKDICVSPLTKQPNHVEDTNSMFCTSALSQNLEISFQSVKGQSTHIPSTDDKENLNKEKKVVLQNPSDVSTDCSLHYRYNPNSSAKSSYDFQKHSDSSLFQNYWESQKVDCKSLNISHTVKKKQKDSQISQKSNKTFVKMPSGPETGTPKQIISASLTNLKRRQSKNVLDIIKDPSIQKKLERLPAYVKGHLTRQLFKSEKVQDLLKTVKESGLMIMKLGAELNSKGEQASEQDIGFHRQLIIQVMNELSSVYDIFFNISIKEQMKIISASRILRQQRKAAQHKNISLPVPLVSEKSNESLTLKKTKLSAATLKSLERKKRSSSIDSRTYTIEDFKGSRPRVCSSSSPVKSHVTSPSRIYKSSSGLNVKRKTTSTLKTRHWK